MKQVFQCPHCHASVTAPDRYAGRSIKCPRCAKDFVAATPAGSRPPVPPNRLIQPAAAALPVPASPPSTPPLPAATPRLPPQGEVSVSTPAPPLPPSPCNTNDTPLKPPYLQAHWRTVPPAALIAVTLLIVMVIALLGYVAGHADSARPVAVEREPPAAPQGTSHTARKPVVVVPQADEKPELAPPAAAPPAEPATTSAGADAKVLTPHALFDKASPAVALIEVHNGKGEEFALGQLLSAFCARNGAEAS